jgi:hypothetical protein
VIIRYLWEGLRNRMSGTELLRLLDPMEPRICDRRPDHFSTVAIDDHNLLWRKRSGSGDHMGKQRAIAQWV